MVDNISLENGSLILWNRSTQEYRFIHKGRELGLITLQEIMHSNNGASPTKVIIDWVATCKARIGEQPAGEPNGPKPKRIIEIPTTGRVQRHAK